MIRARACVESRKPSWPPEGYHCMVYLLAYAAIAACHFIVLAFFEFLESPGARDWWIDSQMSLLWPILWVIAIDLWVLGRRPSPPSAPIADRQTRR